MKRAAWWNPSIGPLPLCATLIVIHVILKEILSRYDIVSCIFAAGNQTPAWMYFVALVFVVIRLSVFLFIPAILAWEAAKAVVGRSLLRRAVSAVVPDREFETRNP